MCDVRRGEERRGGREKKEVGIRLVGIFPLGRSDGVMD